MITAKLCTQTVLLRILKFLATSRIYVLSSHADLWRPFWFFSSLTGGIPVSLNVTLEL